LIKRRVLSLIRISVLPLKVHIDYTD